MLCSTVRIQNYKGEPHLKRWERIGPHSQQEAQNLKGTSQACDFKNIFSKCQFSFMMCVYRTIKTYKFVIIKAYYL